MQVVYRKDDIEAVCAFKGISLPIVEMKESLIYIFSLLIEKRDNVVMHSSKAKCHEDYVLGHRLKNDIEAKFMNAIPCINKTNFNYIELSYDHHFIKLTFRTNNENPCILR